MLKWKHASAVVTQRSVASMVQRNVTVERKCPCGKSPALRGSDTSMLTFGQALVDRNYYTDEESAGYAASSACRGGIEGLRFTVKDKAEGTGSCQGRATADNG